jgi:hypothetical protein
VQSHWYALMQEADKDPKSFAERNLFDSIGKLSDSDFQELSKLQKSVRDGNQKETDKQLDGIRTPDQIIRSTMREIGLDPTQNQAALDALWQKTAEKVDTLQRVTGKKATDEDIQKIVDSLVLDVDAFKGGSILSILPGGAPLFSTTIKKRAFEMTVQDIPPAERAKIHAALRGANIEITDEAELDLYIRTQQRLRK